MFRVTTFDCVSSTNNLVKRALENGEGEGYAVRARRQTGGYGRQGRVWSSPEGGLYLSVLLRPAVPLAKLSTLSLAVAVGVMRACEHACDNHSFLLKWPNDVVVLGSPFASGQGAPSENNQGMPCENARGAFHENVQGMSYKSNQVSSCENVQGALRAQAPFRKLCGISLETYAGGVCVGIGVNTFRRPCGDTYGSVCNDVHESATTRSNAECADYLKSTEHVETARCLDDFDCALDVREGDGREDIGVWLRRADKKNVPAYLADFGFAGTLDELCADVLREVEVAYEEWACCGLSAFLEEWAGRDALAGRAVTLADRNGALVAQGCAEGIDEAGRLIMRLSDGSRFAASSGEVHIV